LTITMNRIVPSPSGLGLRPFGYWLLAMGRAAYLHLNVERELLESTRPAKPIFLHF
jgi:hypothetical protein